MILRKTMRQPRHGIDQMRLWYAVLADEVVRTTLVALKGHEEGCLQPDDVDRESPQLAVFAQGSRSQIHRLVQRRDFGKGTLNPLNICPSHGI